MDIWFQIYILTTQKIINGIEFGRFPLVQTKQNHQK